ncbi:hypothetical protein [Segetibacter koreensis]|uniref:hypothetical protein n=1 Tax=Segetibacter koreensis TaxID=398037 RepID=UPI0003671D04|nr:hypothetical protein [Segetibacter koreensis]
MKQSRVVLSLAVFIIGLNIPSLAQKVLPEVTVTAVNYKYIKSVTDTNAAESVKMLQRQAAVYDVKKSEFYEEDYDTYFISFFIPQGKILAAYDKDGKLLHTAEKFKNIQLPSSVRQSVTKRFPNWNISKDVYLVNYYDANSKQGETSKMYKLLLENGDKRIRVKTNEKGEFID